MGIQYFFHFSDVVTEIADLDCKLIPALSAGGQRAAVHIAQAQGEDP